MTEILTESFCERCGTRYTFESARPRVRLKGVKVLSRGLKNFVLSDDTSLDEAMAAARSETDREATAHQLDAFHKTFNFCMSCRQYTCPNCWNEPEARCLTCAPLALPETPAVVDDLRAFREAILGTDLAPANGTSDHDHAPGIGSAEALAAEAFTAEAFTAEAFTADTALSEPPATWAGLPFGDDSRAAQAMEPAATEAEPLEATGEPGEREASTSNATPEPHEARADVVAPADRARKAAAQTSSLLKRFRPGQSLDAELDAFERQREEQAAAAEPEVAAEIETLTAEPVTAEAALEPEIAAESEPAREPVAAEAPEPEAEPQPEPLAAASATDVVEQPTWRITAPDTTGIAAPPRGGEARVPLQAAPGPATPVDAEPQWPAQPQWPGATPAAGLPFLGRPATPQGGVEALWAASNQELTAAVPAPQGRVSTGIQPCVSCGLSLSANARFCRRCGTLQAR